jgi:hypothetical protein
METYILEQIPEREEHFSEGSFYSPRFFASENTDDASTSSERPVNTPEEDPVQADQESPEETGYYSPEIYKEEEYYGSPQNQSEDDALILFTTSFIEEEVIRKCIKEIDPEYLRAKEWELRWLAAKVRFRV